MAQLKASVLKAHGREVGPEMDTTACAVGKSSGGAVLPAAMAVTAFGLGGDDVTLARLPQRPMMFQAAVVEMQDRVSALETEVDDAVVNGLAPECAKMLRDDVFLTHLDVLRRALLGDLACARGAFDRAASARCMGRACDDTCFSYRAYPWQ